MFRLALSRSFITPFSRISTRSYALKYTNDHEWIDFHGDSTATIGITDHAQQQLGEIVYVGLPEEGAEIEANESFGEVESVKSTSDLLSPVSGVVKSVNQILVDSPSTVNASPEKEGWIIKLEGVNEDEGSDLMDAEAYDEYVKSLD
mmetsp:Transcript_21967/g.37540  ORF Transcript_21967/g.37540 Transcript_21967/m.37540 type:complete len:147 (-) Transcript_21967:99-539(-)